MSEMLEAASKRAAKVRTRADRPSQRRSGSNPRTPAAISARTVCRVGEVAGGGERLRFEGFASVTDRGYEMWDMFGPYTEYVHVGAFTETLAQGELDVPFVLDHDSMRRIARTGNADSPLLLAEVTEGDTLGLHVQAPNLDARDPDVAYIAPKLQTGLIDEMSFRFRITSGRWNDEYDEYHIHAVDLHRGDVAIVGYGANPHTAGSGLRAQRGLSPTARVLLELAAADDGKYSRAG